MGGLCTSSFATCNVPWLGQAYPCQPCVSMSAHVSTRGVGEGGGAKVEAGGGEGGRRTEEGGWRMGRKEGRCVCAGWWWWWWWWWWWCRPTSRAGDARGPVEGGGGPDAFLERGLPTARQRGDHTRLRHLPRHGGEPACRHTIFSHYPPARNITRRTITAKWGLTKGSWGWCSSGLVFVMPLNGSPRGFPCRTRGGCSTKVAGRENEAGALAGCTQGLRMIVRPGAAATAAIAGGAAGGAGGAAL